jgi:hypothetical protein
MGVKGLSEVAREEEGGVDRRRGFAAILEMELDVGREVTGGDGLGGMRDEREERWDWVRECLIFGSRGWSLDEDVEAGVVVFEVDAEVAKSGESGVDTWTSLLGRRTDSRLEERFGLEFLESDPREELLAISERLAVVLDRPIPLVEGFWYAPDGTTVDEPEDDDRSEKGSTNERSILIAVTSLLTLFPLPSAWLARLADTLELFGRPNPRPTSDARESPLTTDHRLLSGSSISSVLPDSFELFLLGPLFRGLSTSRGEAGTGSSEGVEEATRLVPAETRRELGVRYPKDGWGFFLGVWGMKAMSRSSNWRPLFDVSSATVTWREGGWEREKWGKGDGEIRPEEPTEPVDEDNGEGGYSSDSPEDDEECEAVDPAETERGVEFSGRR